MSEVSASADQERGSIIYTFYSYKGGVGRSMALANVAELLRERGLDVLIVDWDLEAPGLERYFNIPVNEVFKCPGVVNIVSDYKNKLAGPSVDATGSDLALLPEVTNYFFKIYDPVADKGGLWLLPSGRRADQDFAEYAGLVRSLSWQDFYQNWEGELFFEWLRKQFLNSFDVVLIDSRTGVTEMGGICTYQMADVVVLFCTANQQNLDGSARMVRSFRRPEVKALRRDRDLHLLVVPSRIEDRAESTLLTNFKNAFLKEFAEFQPAESDSGQEVFWQLKVPHVPYFAFNEEVAARQKQKAGSEALVAAFSKLINEMAKVAPIESAIQQAIISPARESKAKELIARLAASQDPDEVADLISQLERIVGQNHQAVATGVMNLAGLYFNQLRYSDAEAQFQKALGIYNKILGPDNLEMATVLSNLASVHLRQRRYTEAEMYYLQALQIHEKASKPDDLGMAAGYNNLAALYNETGRYHEAENLYRRSLTLYEKSLGAEHPEVAAGLNNLALFLQNQGKPEEAEAMYRRALEINEKTLGPDHPSVAACLNTLAELYGDIGRVGEAMALYRRALAIYERTSGFNHPDAASSLNNLALLCHNQGNYDEAESLYKQALAIYETTLGKDDLNVAISLHNLATLYRDRGDYSQAVTIYRRSVEIYEKVFGPEHPELAESLETYADLLLKAGLKAEAEVVESRLKAIRAESKSEPLDDDLKLLTRIDVTEGWQNHVLWVDDRPDNNIYERHVFEGMGLTFSLALSTDEALGKLSEQRFAAIISDMGRREGSREGYVLLDALRQRGDQTPFFVYTGSKTPEYQKEVLEHGGQGCTNTAKELFKMVIRSINSEAATGAGSPPTAS